MNPIGNVSAIVSFPGFDKHMLFKMLSSEVNDILFAVLSLSFKRADFLFFTIECTRVPDILYMLASSTCIFDCFIQFIFRFNAYCILQEEVEQRFHNTKKKSLVHLASQIAMQLHFIHDSSCCYINVCASVSVQHLPSKQKPC